MIYIKICFLISLVFNDLFEWTRKERELHTNNNNNVNTKQIKKKKSSNKCEEDSMKNNCGKEQSESQKFLNESHLCKNHAQQESVDSGCSKNASKQSFESGRVLCGIAKNSCDPRKFDDDCEKLLMKNEKKKTQNVVQINQESRPYEHPFVSVKKDIQANKRCFESTKCCDNCINNNETLINKMIRGNKIFYNGASNFIDRNITEHRMHASELLQFLLTLWKENKMCDLNFKIGGNLYSAHRVALAMFSQKYNEIFQKQQNEQNNCTYTIALHNTTESALKAILNYIYTSEIDINPANADEILNGAKEIRIDNLICMAQDYLDSLSIGDVLSFMHNLFDRNGGELVSNQIYVYMMTHLNKISRTPEYYKASVNTIKVILSDSNICVSNEVEIFDAAMSWIYYDRKNREKYTVEVLKCVRFTLMSPQDIHTKTQTHPILNQNPELSQIILNAFKFHSFKCCNDKAFVDMIKREESRGKTLKGSSVPESFVVALRELAEIALILKEARTNATSNTAKIIDSYDDDDEDINSNLHHHHKCYCNRNHVKSTHSGVCCKKQHHLSQCGKVKHIGSGEKLLICKGCDDTGCCNGENLNDFLHSFDKNVCLLNCNNNKSESPSSKISCNELK